MNQKRLKISDPISMVKAVVKRIVYLIMMQPRESDGSLSTYYVS